MSKHSSVTGNQNSQSAFFHFVLCSPVVLYYYFFLLKLDFFFFFVGEKEEKKEKRAEIKNGFSREKHKASVIISLLPTASGLRFSSPRATNYAKKKKLS